jgi:hypothetical protein
MHVVGELWRWLAGEASKGVFPGEKKFHEYLNFLWSVVRSGDIPPLQEVLAASKKVYRLWTTTFRKFEVISPRVELYWPEDTAEIIVPVSILRSGRTIYAIYVNDFEPILQVQANAYPIVASLVNEVASKFVEGHTYKVVSLIMDAYLVRLDEYNPVRNLTTVVSHILEGMSTAKFPRIGKQCSYCSKRAYCKWAND